VKAWMDGQFVPQEEAKVPILSHSFSRGSAIFEVMDVVSSPEGPALFRIDAHVDRFFRSAELLHMPLPLGKARLVEAVKETVRANALAAGAVKFFGYYASPELGLIPREARAHVAIFCFDMRQALAASGRRLGQPVTAGIAQVRKLSPSAVAIHAKVAGHYMNAFLARWEAVRKGYDDAIMLDEAGCVAEGPLSNLFFVRDAAVSTPKLNNALAGVTRDSVIEIARAMGLACVEADITSEQAASADEAFYTGSVVRIKPIRAIDGRNLGPSCPGPVTSRIQAAFDSAYEGREVRYRKWLTYVG
jgi:branched-chain amino acid aminotransferase